MKYDHNYTDIATKMEDIHLSSLKQKTRKGIAGIKLWRHSFYNFNHNYTRTFFHKNYTIKNIIDSYYNLYNNKGIFESKRARVRLRRNKLGSNIIISKPDIKESNNQARINIFVFDKTSNRYIRKLYSFNNNISNNFLWKNIYDKQKLSNYFSNKDKFIKSYVNTLYDIFFKTRSHGLIYNSKNNIKKRKTILKFFNKNRFAIKNLSKSPLHISKQRKTTKNILSPTILEKRKNKIFFYKNWKNNAKIFQLNNLEFNNKLKIISKYINVTYYNMMLELIYQYINTIYTKKTVKLNEYMYVSKLRHDAATRLRSLHKHVDNMKRNQLNNTVHVIRHIKLIESFNYNLLRKIKLNTQLSDIRIVSIGTKLITKEISDYFFREKNNLIRELIKANNYYKLYHINQLKNNLYINSLSSLLKNFFNKKIILNIIKLKYIHLNSDLLVSSIAKTIKRKKNPLLRLIKNSLSLVKLPKGYNENINTLSNLVNVNAVKNYSIAIGRSLYSTKKSNVSYFNVDTNNTFINKLYSLFSMKGSFFNNIYLHDFLQKKKIHDIINILNYKWVSGVRLESSGRLTRRYTASRSVFKLKYKGSLKNIDYSVVKLHRDKISYNMLRGDNRANVQFTFVSSKKRIGAFGIKGWLGSY